MEPQRGQIGGESVMPYYLTDLRHRLGNRGKYVPMARYGTTGRDWALQGATIRDSYFPKCLIYIEFKREAPAFERQGPVVRIHSLRPILSMT